MLTLLLRILLCTGLTALVFGTAPLLLAWLVSRALSSRQGQQVVSMSSLSLLPLYIKSLAASLSLGASLSISVSLASFVIRLNLVETNKSLICIEINGLCIYLKGLRWAAAMESSPSASEESISSELKKLVIRAVSVTLQDLSVDVEFLDSDALRVHATAENILVNTGGSSEGSSCVGVAVRITGGTLCIRRDDELIFNYEGKCCEVSVDYQVLSSLL